MQHDAAVDALRLDPDGNVTRRVRECVANDIRDGSFEQAEIGPDSREVLSDIDRYPAIGAWLERVAAEPGHVAIDA